MMRILRLYSSSLACRVRIEDHRLLADFYFAIFEAARALVDVQDCTRRVQLCVDKPETARDRAFSKQALAGAENNGKLPDTERIDKIVLEQGLEEVAAAVDLYLAPLPVS